MQLGLWVDADSVCLRPFDDLLEPGVSLFAGYVHCKSKNLQR